MQLDSHGPPQPLGGVPSDSQQPWMLCCLCAASIPANEAGMCLTCLKTQVDATAGIERHLVLAHCKHCGRYQRPPWLVCEWESKELLALCLKKIKGLSHNRRDVRLINAAFLYTEPHSKRVKVKLTLQKEFAASTVIEQDCVVEFVIQAVQCDDCKRAFTPHTWTAVVQVRQRTQHKRSLMYLEQVILKSQAHEKVIKVVEAPDGLDFQFSTKSAAQKFSEFVASTLISRVKSSKTLVSHDPKSNTQFHKFTFMQEICSVCKDDLVYLPPHLSHGIFGGMSPFLLCTKAGTSLTLVDPLSGRTTVVHAEKFWKYPFEQILTRRHMTDFVVLYIEPVAVQTAKGAVKAGAHALKGLARGPNEMSDVGDDTRSMTSQCTNALTSDMVDVEIARVADLGNNDDRIVVKSHLGRSLRVGDSCRGYDLRSINVPGHSVELSEKLPAEVLLVGKIRKRGGRRSWVLQRLPKERATGGPGGERELQDDKLDLEELKQDLEDNPDLREGVNLWKDPRAGLDLQDDEADPIKICTLLEGLQLEDVH